VCSSNSLVLSIDISFIKTTPPTTLLVLIAGPPCCRSAVPVDRERFGRPVWTPSIPIRHYGIIAPMVLDMIYARRGTHPPQERLRVTVTGPTEARRTAPVIVLSRQRGTGDYCCSSTTWILLSPASPRRQ